MPVLVHGDSALGADGRLMPDIVHDVFVEFHDVVDKVLLGEETVR